MNGPNSFTIWVRNDATKEAAQFKGQGDSIPAAFKDGWDNATEDFGKNSSGGPPISRAHLAVRLPDGKSVFRRPEAFASREPYDPARESREFELPTTSGEASQPFADLVAEGRASFSKPKK